MTARMAPSSQKLSRPLKASLRSRRVLNDSSSSSGGANSLGWPPSITRSSVEPERGGDRTNTARRFFRGRRIDGKGSIRSAKRSRSSSPIRSASAVSAASSASRYAASDSTVGWSKITTTWTIWPSSCWRRLISTAPLIELPPSSKKWSVAPARSTSSTSWNRPATKVSRGVRGSM